MCSNAPPYEITFLRAPELAEISINEQGDNWEEVLRQVLDDFFGPPDKDYLAHHIELSHRNGTPVSKQRPADPPLNKKVSTNTNLVLNSSISGATKQVKAPAKRAEPKRKTPSEKARLKANGFVRVRSVHALNESPKSAVAKKSVETEPIEATETDAAMRNVNSTTPGSRSRSPQLASSNLGMDQFANVSCSPWSKPYQGNSTPSNDGSAKLQSAETELIEATERARTEAAMRDLDSTAPVSRYPRLFANVSCVPWSKLYEGNSTPSNDRSAKLQSAETEPIEATERGRTEAAMRDLDSTAPGPRSQSPQRASSKFSRVSISPWMTPYDFSSTPSKGRYAKLRVPSPIFYHQPFSNTYNETAEAGQSITVGGEVSEDASTRDSPAAPTAVHKASEIEELTPSKQLKSAPANEKGKEVYMKKKAEPLVERLAWHIFGGFGNDRSTLKVAGKVATAKPNTIWVRHPQGS